MAKTNLTKPHHYPNKGDNSPKALTGQIWKSTVIVATSIIAILVPLQLVLHPGDNPLPSAWNLLLTGILAGDVFIRLRVGTGLSGAKESEANSAHRLGSVSLAIADVVAAIPWMLLTGVPALELLRLVKVTRLTEAFRWQRSGDILHRTLLRLARFSFWVVLTVHWLACGWIALRGIESTSDRSGVYLESLYWCVTTLTSVGYGDITPQTAAEKLYAMLLMILGVGVYGFVIGNVANLLSKIDMIKATYQSNIDRLSGFLRYRDVPADLRQRIFEYFAYLWEKRRGYDESMVLAELPPSLRTELSLILKQEVVAKVPFLQEASGELIRDLCQCLNPEVYMPDDVIYRSGEIGRHMYFVGSGRVDLVGQDDAAILETVEAGGFFGEIALLHGRPRLATARAADYCDLYVLNKESFDRVLSRYPDFAAHMQEVADARWRRGHPVIRVRYRCLGKTILADEPDLSLLDLSIANKIPHTRECGGNARCTTCRIRILDGLHHVSPRTPAEAAMARERRWDDSTRLACQVRVTGHVEIERVVQNAAQISALQTEILNTDAPEERELAILHCRLYRTRDQANAQLPLDVLHLANAVFRELGEPVIMNDGVVYPKSSDSFLAVFGIRSVPPRQSCLAAVRAALGMANATPELGQRVSESFGEQLHFGLALHFGSVVLGLVGHPSQQQVAALGQAPDEAQRFNDSVDLTSTRLAVSKVVLSKLGDTVLDLGDELAVAETTQIQPHRFIELRGFAEPDGILLVQNSIPRLFRDSAAFADAFYTRLFETAPELQRLFQGDMRLQGRMLTHMLRGTAYSLSRPDHMDLSLKKLGRQHEAYGVTSDHYAAVRAALLETIANRLEGAFTPGVRRAWEYAVDLILNRMRGESGGMAP